MKSYKMFELSGEETHNYGEAAFLYFPTAEAIDDLIADSEQFYYSICRDGEGWYFFRVGNRGAKYYRVPDGLVYAIQSQKIDICL